MASLIENLIGILKEENEVYQTLLNLSLEKTSVIVKADLEKLQAIVSQEQLLLSSINKMDKSREDIIKDITNVLNVTESDFKVDKLIKMLEKQPKEQEMLSKVRDDLKRTMNQLVKVNDNNKVLLKESIDMIEFELNISRNSMLAPQTANYSRQAFNAPVQTMRLSAFDAKQ